MTLKGPIRPCEGVGCQEVASLSGEAKAGGHAQCGRGRTWRIPVFGVFNLSRKCSEDFDIALLIKATLEMLNALECAPCLLW